MKLEVLNIKMDKNLKILAVLLLIIFLLWALQSGYLIYIIGTAEGLAVANFIVYVTTGVGSALVAYILTKYKDRIFKKH